MLGAVRDIKAMFLLPRRAIISYTIAPDCGFDVMSKRANHGLQLASKAEPRFEVVCFELEIDGYGIDQIMIWSWLADNTEKSHKLENHGLP